MLRGWCWPRAAVIGVCRCTSWPWRARRGWRGRRGLRPALASTAVIVSTTSSCSWRSLQECSSPAACSPAGAVPARASLRNCPWRTVSSRSGEAPIRAVPWACCHRKRQLPLWWRRRGASRARGWGAASSCSSWRTASTTFSSSPLSTLSRPRSTAER